MDKDGQQTTLRDQLTQAFEKQEQAEQPVTETKSEIQAQETPEQKADRERDEKGRFSKNEKKPEISKKQETVVEVKPAEIKQRPARPSSWKKEMWDHWEKLDPSVAEYLSQREQEYAKGVSTYKQEWEASKPLHEAMAPFLPTLQQNGIKPEEWITNLGTAHQRLALGTPEQKLSMLLNLVQDYQIPLQGLFVRGQDGQIYINPQIQRYQPQAQPQQARQPDPRQVFEELFEERVANQEVQMFASQKDQYPYFEQVKDTMAGLLQAGQAQDLKSAYDKAIRLDDTLFQTLQQKQQEEKETARKAEAAKLVQGAKAKTVSVKSSTPAGNADGKGKGLRGIIEAAVDESTARV